MSVPATADPNALQTGAVAPSTGPGAGAPQAGEQRTDPTQVSRSGNEEQVTRSPDYVREAFRQLRGQTQTASAPPAEPEQRPAPQEGVQAPPVSPSAPEPERPVAPREQRSGPAATTLPPPPTQGRGQQQRQPATTGATQDGNGPITLTREELARTIQSEADRILAKRQKDDETRAAQERERQMRRTDPFGYANLMEEKEQQLEASKRETERLTGIVHTQLQFYDRAVLDTFVGALPEDERGKVISREADGIENRKQTASATLKALRNRWVAEGRASAKADLMKDQTFIKEILARYGHATPEPDPAPVAIRPPANATPENGHEGMNSWIRSAAGAARATSN